MIGKNYDKIEIHPRSFDSKAKTDVPQNMWEWMTSSVAAHLQSWRDYNDQLCLAKTKLNDRGVEEVEVVSTGVTQEMLEKFIKNPLPSDENQAIIKFLHDATDLDISQFLLSDQQSISRLILAAPGSLASIREILLSNKSKELLSTFLDNTTVLKNLEPSILKTIISLDDAVYVIKGLSVFPISDQDLLNKILNSKEPHEIINVVGMHPDLPKSLPPDLFRKILNSADPAGMLNFLSDKMSFVDEIRPDLWDKIFASNKPKNIMDFLGKSPSSIEFIKTIPLELLEKILTSAKPDQVLFVLAKNPDLLTNTHITPAHWETIFNFAEPGAALLFFAKKPKLFEQKNFTPELLNKILLSPTSGSILDTLDRTPKLLTTIPIDRWDSILACKAENIMLVLDILQKYPNSATLDRELWNIALASSKPDDALNELRKYPELLKMKQFTPELLNKILSSSKFANIFATLNKYPQLLTALPINDLNQCFTSPKEASSQLLTLGKKLAINELQEELKLESEKLTLLTTLINKDAEPKMVRAFLKLGDQGLEYAQMYLKADAEEAQMLNAITAPYVIARLEQLESQSSGPFLNLPNLINDPKAHLWNSLPIRENDINDEQWLQLRTDFKNKLKEIFPGDENSQKLKDAKSWFDKLSNPESRDAKAGLQVIRKRMASIIDFIIQQPVDPNAKVNEALTHEGIEIEKELVNILAEGGTACDDRAAVFLEKAEMYAKAFIKKEDGTDYALNVAVNEFKRNLVLVLLVNMDEREALESLLSRMILLNEPLGLEYATKNMHYPDAATKMPLDAAMKPVYNKFTTEELIGFVQEHPLMETKFRSDSKAMAEFQELLNDSATGLNELGEIDGKYPDDIPDEFIKRVEFLLAKAPSGEAISELYERFGMAWTTASEGDEFRKANPEKAEKLQSLYNKMPRMIDNFKAEKTKTILMEEGFLSPNAHYEDIDRTYWTQKPVDFSKMGQHGISEEEAGFEVDLDSSEEF